MEVNRFGGVLAAAAALVLIVSGCSTAGGSESPNGSSGAGQGSQSDALSAESIVAAIEANGFECKEKKTRGKTREQQIQCKADDYVFITATRMSSVDALEKLIPSAKRAVCESEIGDGFRGATSDTWLLVPGGDREIDIAAFDTAMSDLGLEWTEDLC